MTPPADTKTNTSGHGVAAGDLNGDGDPDLLAGRGDIPSGKIDLLLYLNTVRRK